MFSRPSTFRREGRITKPVVVTSYTEIFREREGKDRLHSQKCVEMKYTSRAYSHAEGSRLYVGMYVADVESVVM